MFVAIILGIVLLIVFLFYYLFVYRNKVLMKNMALAVDLVKVGLFGRLARKLESDYEREKAGLLAAAITNQLFYESASNQEGQEFSEANQDSIWREIAILMEDEPARNIISQAVRVKSTLSYAQNR